MNLYTAFLLFILTIFIFLVISEVFTILFRLTGLDDEIARFQVTSLLTGSGFTTEESELITSVRQRRKLARMTMMFGNIFNVTFVSSFVNIFLSFRKTELHNFLTDIALPLLLILIIFALARLPAVRAKADHILKSIIEKMIGDTNFNPLTVIDYVDSNCMVQVRLKTVPEALKGIRLADSDLKSRYNIMVLLTEDRKGRTTYADADTVLHPGTKVTLYGDYNTICHIFHARELYTE